MMRKINKLIEPVKNIINPAKKEETPLIFIPADQSYMEILGRRIDGIDNFESFLEYLKKMDDLERIKNAYRDEYKQLRTEKEKLVEYLSTKLEESKLMATYENGVRYPCMKELVYKDVLDRVESGDYDK